MNADLRELYQNVILDHHKKPRNSREMADADRDAEGYNPLCGDRVHVFLKLDGDVIKDVSFVGSGYAISTAAATRSPHSESGTPTSRRRASSG